MKELTAKERGLWWDLLETLSARERTIAYHYAKSIPVMMGKLRLLQEAMETARGTYRSTKTSKTAG